MAAGEPEAGAIGKAYVLFAGAFAFVLAVIAIVAELGLADIVVGFIVIALTLVTYVAIGIVSRTLSLPDFFIAGRSVPPELNGLATALALVSVGGFAGLAGAFFAGGIGALAIGLGWSVGMVLLATLVAPYYRKSGAVTVPDFLAVRFGNPLLRAGAVIVLVVSLVPLLVAAIAAGGWILGIALHIGPEPAVATIVVVLLLSSLAGGMRAVTFVAGAQAIVFLAGLIVPATLFSAEEYGFPIAQLSYGAALQSAGPGDASIAAIAGRIMPLASLDWFNLFALAVTFAAAAVALPQVLARSGTTATAGDARRSVGWSLVVIAAIVLTAPAIAAFARAAMLDSITGAGIDGLPQWVFDYGRLGLAKLCGVDATTVEAIKTACASSGSDTGGLEFSADAVALAFGQVTGEPTVMTALAAAAALAAALAGAAAALIAITTSIGHDVYTVLAPRKTSAGRRLIVSRLIMILVAAGAGWLALNRADDAFAYAAAAPAVAASGLFPALILGVWWERTTFWGALAGLVAGFAAAVAYVYLVRSGMPPLRIIGLTDGIAATGAAIIGLPAGFAVAIVVSYLTPAPSLARRAVGDAIRRPGRDPILEDHAA